MGGRTEHLQQIVEDTFCGTEPKFELRAKTDSTMLPLLVEHEVVVVASIPPRAEVAEPSKEITGSSYVIRAWQRRVT